MRIWCNLQRLSGQQPGTVIKIPGYPVINHRGLFVYATL